MIVRLMLPEDNGDPQRVVHNDGRHHRAYAPTNYGHYNTGDIIKIDVSSGGNYYYEEFFDFSGMRERVYLHPDWFMILSDRDEDIIATESEFLADMSRRD